MNIFKFKILGFITLTMYSLAYCGFFTSMPVHIILGTLGAMCVTIYAFLIDEAFKNTASLNKLMIFALLMSILTALPYRYVYISAESASNPKLFFSAALTSFFCIGGLFFYSKMKSAKQRIFCVLFICIISFFILDFMPYTVIITYIIHICREKKFSEMAYYIIGLSVLLSVFAIVFYNCGILNKLQFVQQLNTIGFAFPVFLIKKYDGTKGPSIKLISKVFYLFLLCTILAIKII